MLEHLDRLGTSAEIIGAVNCVVRHGDELVGENTDGHGFLSALRTAADPKGRALALFGAAARPGRSRSRRRWRGPRTVTLSGDARTVAYPPAYDTRPGVLTLVSDGERLTGGPEAGSGSIRPLRRPARTAGVLADHVGTSQRPGSLRSARQVCDVLAARRRAGAGSAS